ncbi:F-box only protein 3-like [Tubulanus polymorphus]|uniref:F-box only protein 3-like n=1 Tax=Tubulanus polymorphus TaxID=672921 RepID=UPI003DA508E0
MDSDCFSTSILDLPHEAVLHICRYLDYPDLKSLGQTCKMLQDIADDNFFWKKLCKYYWLDECCPEGKSWKQHFYSIYEQFGRYKDVYRKIRRAWKKIEEFTKENCPVIHRTLNKGLSETQLAEIEEKLQCNLPEDLRCSYRIHNGQEICCNTNQFVFAGLMGTKTSYMQLFQEGDYYFNNNFSSDHLFDLNEATNQYQMYRDLDGFIALTICTAHYDSQFISINDESGIDIGMVVHPDPVVGNLPLGVTPELDISYDCFIMANSFTEWLCSHADNLEAKLYPVLDEHIYKFLKEPSCTWTTNFITVTVATCFMPEYSSIAESTFCHAYFITLHMADNAPKEEVWQLETRHWEIIDENDVKEVVDGPGVVGEYPIMRPGSKHSWISSTRFSTSYGNMRGHFTMKHIRTGKTIDVICPVFHMQAPKFVTSDDRSLRRAENFPYS